MVKPSLTARMQGKQEAAKDHGKEIRAFTPGDPVMVRSFRGSDKWKPGVVMQRLGQVSYMVRVNEQLRHVHIDHLIRETVYCRDTRMDPMEILVEPHVQIPVPPVPQPQNAPNANIPIHEQPAAQAQQREQLPIVQPAVRPCEVQPVRRNPPRHFGPPKRFDL